MVDGHFPFDRSSAQLIGGTLTSVILLIAPGALAQDNPLRTLPFATRSSTLLQPVADDRPVPGPGSFADLAEKIEPAVIAVTAKTPSPKSLGDELFGLGTPDQESPDSETRSQDLPGQGRVPPSHETVAIGSGFFISADGYAVTNSHVVGDADTAEIRTHDNKTYSAKVIGKDLLSDLALIKVDGHNDFASVKLADQPPRVGDWVLSAGNPFGLGGTVTAGIVSARERSIETGPAEDFLQIDAPINKGDSGGPSFNTKGEVVGVNSMIFSPSGGSVGVAFAVPADTVKSVIPQLKNKGLVTRGWMGAELQSITPDIADGLGQSGLHGAIVAGVQRGSPAAKAGLETGDIVTSASGQPIRTASGLAKKIYAMSPGSSVQLSLLRHGKEQASIDVTLGQMPQTTSTPARIPK